MSMDGYALIAIIVISITVGEIGTAWASAWGKRKGKEAGK